MPKALKVLLAGLMALSLVPMTALGDDEENKPEAAETAENSGGEAAAEGGDEAMKKALESSDGESQAEAKSEGDSAETAQAEDTSEKDKRDALLYDRLKRFVQKVDRAGGKGIEFPAPNVERALRQEFIRRADGKVDIFWRGKKRVKKDDGHVALDNLELLVTYAEKLHALSSKKKAKGKDLEEMKLMAVKAVIDHFNRPKNRELMTITENPKSLSQFGRAERQRRIFLVAGQVGGDDYASIGGKSYDDFTKQYRKALTVAVKSYDKFSELLGGGRAGRSVASTDDAAPAPTEKGKKAKGKDKDKKDKPDKGGKGAKGKNAKKPAKGKKK